MSILTLIFKKINTCSSNGSLCLHCFLSNVVDGLNARELTAAPSKLVNNSLSSLFSLLISLS